MNLAYISHHACQDHDMGKHHPESPERLHAIQDRLIASGMEMLVTHYDAPEATFEQLNRVHDADYIRLIERSRPKEDRGVTWIDGDTAMCRATWPAALHSAGAAILGVDLVMEGKKHHAAFCCVRPPGHHAGRRTAGGFCFFNNVAVGAAHALEHHGLERVLIVDFDVHHGNGTEDIFIGDERVLFCSSFQHPFYPHSGADTDAPNIINLPLPSRTGGPEFRAAVEAAWLPRIEAFRPQLIMISAGFDGHAEDDMSHFTLREPDYAWITRKLHEAAGGTPASGSFPALEGGYESVPPRA